MTDRRTIRLRETALKAYNDWSVSAEVRKGRREFLGGYIDLHGPLELPDGKLLGWDVSGGKRNFGVFDAPKPDPLLEDAARKAGVLSDA